ncbi:hypothetical protein TanjilG_05373 [Lupinus angustifolius]|uniref:BHLH domain-containing protein n=2 Tax=Lupinus angustifolius TaxID=3871 RepID=A0A1J7HPM2_LUPAN|nr:hypothetical protein TanjilG_05373 [Lupinus angustifolius]
MDKKYKRNKVGSNDEESKRMKKNETCSDTSKENSKGSYAQKGDYIHVRARRGQATDSHSLAERIRREKISERMKYLQDLVPGCNKVTGKAGTLDEIINYVQSLQQQVEFLSMKLAAMNPNLDYNIYDMFTKEMFPTCTPSYSTIGISSDMTNPAYLQFKSQQEMVSSCGFDTVKNPPELHGSIPETCLDSSNFNQILPHSSTWEGDFQNLYTMAFDQAIATPTPFSSQQFTGLVEYSNLMEM